MLVNLRMALLKAGPCGLRLNKEAAEKKNAQNYDYRNDDDLNQAHSKFLGWLRANKILKASEF